MPELPKIEGLNRLKPLSYDPQTKHFITFDEVVSGKAKLVPLYNLSQQDLTKLVAARNRVGPDYTMADLNGKILNRDQIVDQVLKGTDFGKIVVEAETSYLKDFNKQIEQALESKRPR